MTVVDRVGGLFAGIACNGLGYSIVAEKTPVIIKYGHSFPVVHWLGWAMLFFGTIILLTNIRGLFTDRKKHRAAIERCKAEHQREAEAAKGENTE